MKQKLNLFELYAKVATGGRVTLEELHARHHSFTGYPNYSDFIALHKRHDCRNQAVTSIHEEGNAGYGELPSVRIVLESGESAVIKNWTLSDFLLGGSKKRMASAPNVTFI